MEQIDHPDHYGGDTTYETIKVIEAWGLGFHLGNAVKYISRAGKKDEDLIADLQKARWYIDRHITSLAGGVEIGDSVGSSKEDEEPSAGRKARAASGRKKGK